MKENIVENLNFLCIEVDENSTMEYLEKRFDELFPNKIIRLIINKKYSPYFYIRKGLWVYKKPSKNKRNFSFKVLLNENSVDYVKNNEISFLYYIGINIEHFNVISELGFNDYIKTNGIFLSNGYTHIFQQDKMNVDYIYELFSQFLDCEIFYNSLNVFNNGILIVKTKTNILGENN